MPKLENQPVQQYLDPIPQYSICFCSISTSAYGFDIDKASSIACEVIYNWLEDHRDLNYIKIYLVDLLESETLEKFREKSSKYKDPRFEIKVANLVKLKDFKIPCSYIVNASNPYFKSGGSGTNKAIHRSCKGDNINLEKLTLKQYKTPAEVAKAYPVDLLPGIPLRDEQDVRTVIHVVGPNMSISSKRVNNLKGDYEKGSPLLRKAYEDVLNVFLQKISPDRE